MTVSACDVIRYRRRVAYTSRTKGGPGVAYVVQPVTNDVIPSLERLELKPGQDRFVAPVMHSLAEAHVTRTAWPRVILDDDEVVGFVMANFDADNELVPFRCGIWRMNVAAHAQGRGVGRFAVEEVAREARHRGFTRMTVLWESGEGSPEGFYLRCGFRPTGQILFGEVVAERSTEAAQQ